MALLRFAPSPTGSLHLGGLRTVLFNHLLSRKLGGKWLLRIEDTDASRYVPGSVEELARGLDWAGLTPDYGPFQGGPHGPYYQSKRLDLYKSYADKLLEQRHAYRCFCSPDRLADTRTRLLKLGSNATYDRRCLDLTDEEVARRVRAGEKHVVRLLDTAVPVRASVSDLVFGVVKDVHTSLPTDTILLKSDMFPTYHLASVVDDHEMGITDVLRGEEWLPSLPLHLDLYACLRWNPPRFGHLPLLLNSDGTKMSKRASGMHVASFMAGNYEPEAVLNWLFILGLSRDAHEEDFFDMDGMLRRMRAPARTRGIGESQCIAQPSIDGFSSHRAILDHKKLLYLNRLHLRHKVQSPDAATQAAVARRAVDEIVRQLPQAAHVDAAYALKALQTEGDRVETLADLPAVSPYLFAPPDYTSEEAVKLRKAIPDETLSAVCRATCSHLEGAPWDQPVADWWPGVLADIKSTSASGNKHTMFTLRYVLTGRQHGPPVVDFLQLLGRKRTMARLAKALTQTALDSDE
ncbi:glutamyl-tRNA synthetase [Auricularia subglabra TFB-10046 SS5]|nr:glutamyl-tRNA synthetase [Auricularia subglabra TFB-10046 SS5]